MTSLLAPPDVDHEVPVLVSPESRGARLIALAAEWVPMTAVLAVAGAVRLIGLDAIGYNSDEAVYAGTAASMAGDQELQGMFPVFRAHPLLYQALVAVGYAVRPGEQIGRVVSALLGVAAVLATHVLARRLYGPVAGTVAALLLALMPYHVVVSRQVLLDGQLTLFGVLTLYCVARYAQQPALRWMLAAGGMAGLATLSKETALVLLGGLYAFFATTTSVTVRMRHVLAAAGALALIVAAFPLVLNASGRSSTGQNYLLWQLTRRPNHPLGFYAHVVPRAVGWLVLIAAVAGLIVLFRRATWRESLLLWWIAVPVAFFTLWPVKGYQYLLPAAPALAVLAGRAIAHLALLPLVAGRRTARRALIAAVTVLVAGSLAVPTWQLVHPSARTGYLAGTGGVPGGREAGRWIAAHAPDGAQLLTVGPSMANILQFYGRHRAYGLSVSANPRDRNPAYVPVANPDLWVRSGRVQYLVWDAYSAARTPFFTQRLTRLVERYHGVPVHTGTVEVRTPSGALAREPVVIIYQVSSS